MLMSSMTKNDDGDDGANGDVREEEGALLVGCAERLDRVHVHEEERVHRGEDAAVGDEDEPEAPRCAKVFQRDLHTAVLKRVVLPLGLVLQERWAVAR